MARISDIIIGIVFVSVFVVGFSMISANLQSSYGILPGDDAINLTKYNQLNDINTLSNEIKGNVTEIKQQSGILDVIGGYFSSGYKVLIISAKSMNYLEDMINQSFIDGQFGDLGVYLRNALITSFIIIIFIGIIMSALVKREM